jgi:hypothetical protein
MVCRTGTPIAVATMWQVIWAHAASAPRRRSPEHAAVPAPPTPGWACALAIARPASTEHAIGPSCCVPDAVSVMREVPRLLF